MGIDFDRGRRVGKYELLTRITVGGMAELYLAFLPGPGGFKKFVALKQILPDARRDDAFVKMFLDEARITAAFNHPNIGQVFDLGVDAGSGELYLAMEFIAGQNLGAVTRAAVVKGLRCRRGSSAAHQRSPTCTIRSADGQDQIHTRTGGSLHTATPEFAAAACGAHSSHRRTPSLLGRQGSASPGSAGSSGQGMALALCVDGQGRLRWRTPPCAGAMPRLRE